MQRRGFSPQVTAFTKPGTADGDRRFFPLTGARDSSQCAKVLALLILYAITGDMYFQLAFQESDNPEVWPDATAFTIIGTSNTTTGPTFTNGAYEAITTTKPWVRFGVLVRNNNGNPPKIELCWVAGRFDTRPC